jgi:colanic acid biosynthesis glycosyl transferase WcaI
VAPVLFLICGDGQAAPKLRSLAGGLSNVRFAPFQPAERLNQLLNVADIHALPQVPEVADSVLPSKLLGMLTSGRCIVATVGEQSEVGGYVKECGLLVPPGDSAALAGAIRTLAADAELRARLGSAARRHALESLRHDLILGAFEAHIAQRLRHTAPDLRPRTKEISAQE